MKKKSGVKETALQGQCLKLTLRWMASGSASNSCFVISAPKDAVEGDTGGSPPAASIVDEGADSVVVLVVFVDAVVVVEVVVAIVDAVIPVSAVALDSLAPPPPLLMMVGIVMAVAVVVLLLPLLLFSWLLPLLSVHVAVAAPADSVLAPRKWE